MQIAEMECKQTGGDPSSLDLTKLSQMSPPPSHMLTRDMRSREDTSAANVKKAKANRVKSNRFHRTKILREISIDLYV